MSNARTLGRRTLGRWGAAMAAGALPPPLAHHAGDVVTL